MAAILSWAFIVNDNVVSEISLNVVIRLVASLILCR